jgi:hypothetical protein
LYDYYEPDNDENDIDDMAEAAVIHVCCGLYLGRLATVIHHLESFSFKYYIVFFVVSRRLDDSAGMRSKQWRESATRTHSGTVIHHSHMSCARSLSLA